MARVKAAVALALLDLLRLDSLAFGLPGGVMQRNGGGGRTSNTLEKFLSIDPYAYMCVDSRGAGSFFFFFS